MFHNVGDDEGLYSHMFLTHLHELKSVSLLLLVNRAFSCHINDKFTSPTELDEKIDTIIT